MYGLSREELRFAMLISSAHFAQHVYYRVLPPLIPVLAVALEYPLWQLGLLISLYTIGMGITQAPLGVLSDRYDRRYILPTGIAITGLAYVLFAVAPPVGAPLPAVTIAGHAFEGGFLVMSLAMMFVGIGLSVVHPVGYPMITDNVSDSNKGRVLGVFGASSKFGDAAAPAVIAVLILMLAWHQIILLFGVVGVLYGIVLYAVLANEAYETVPSGRRTETEDESVEESKGRSRRAFLYPMLIVYSFFIFSMLSTHALNSFLPAFLVGVYEYSLEISGVAVGAESIANVYFALLLVSGAMTQLVLGGLADRYDSRLILIACMAVATAGMVTLAWVSLHPLLLVFVIIVLGTGLYGVNPARDALISDLSPPEYEGRTFGYIFTAISLTGAPLPTVIGYLLDLVGMREGFLILAVGPALAGICVGMLYSDRVYQSEPDVDASVTASD